MNAIFERESFNLGELITEVFAIKEENEAREFFEQYTDWIIKHEPKLTENAETVARSNIGWIFGEGMETTCRQMWAKVCGAVHPVFGPGFTTDGISPEKALEVGMAWGKESLEKK